MVLRKTSPHLVRCDLCQKVSHNLYQVEIGEDNLKYKFCSGMHAQTAKENFDKNIELKRTPSILPEEITPQEGGMDLGLAE